MFVLQAWAAGLLGIAQIFFIVNLVRSLARGKASAENPWQATTLEWSTTSPPPHDNFAVAPTVHRGPYDYSPAGSAADFVPQGQR